MLPTDLSAPGVDTAPLYAMLNQLGEKQARNRTRLQYSELKNTLQDLGISLPPTMRHIDAVLGWPVKAVQVLAQRIRFDTFVLPGADQDPFGLADVLADNDAGSALPQLWASALTSSVAFLTVTPGDPGRGEPPVRWLPVDAMHATGLWDRRAGSLSHGLTIETDESGVPVALVWFARDVVRSWVKREAGKWDYAAQANHTGRVWMEPMPYRPDLSRPFGRSRISRAVMSLTDAGMRTLARSESHAEFFASPQRYALGVDDEAFGSKMDRWKAVMSQMLTISRDENGDIPTLGQFPQMSMSPHFEHLRTLASLFAGETSVPLTSLGIVQDNPSSAEAIYAAKEELVVEAGDAAAVWGDRLRRAAVTSVMIRDGLTQPPAELRKLQAKWRNPATPSVVSAADAAVKRVSAVPWLADSEVILEDMGYDGPTITRLLADRRRARGRAELDALLAGPELDSEPVSGGVPA